MKKRFILGTAGIVILILLLTADIVLRGKILYLSKANQIVDQVEVPALKTNVTWSRIGEECSKTEATIGLTNQNAVIISDKQVESPIFSRQGGLKYVEPIEIKNVLDYLNLYSACTDILEKGGAVRKFFIYSDRDSSKLKHVLNQQLVMNREVETQGFIRCKAL